MAITEQIKNLRDRIDESPDIGNRDADTLRAFDRRLTLLAMDYSDQRHRKLLGHGVIMAEQLESGVLTDALEDRNAAEQVVEWINSTYDNEETNRDYRTALRVIGRRLAESGDIDVETDADGLPVAVGWVPSGTSSAYDPTPDPREMLREDQHIQPMIEAAVNPRDAAMVALNFDAGLRGGEFKQLAVGDVQDHDRGLQVTVNGKQGRRTVSLIYSVPHVTRWLDAHPTPDDPDAPLWSKLDRAEGISDRLLGDALDRLADRAGVDKNVTLTKLRKSSAAFLASRNVNQAHIEDHHGWVRGSDAAARYISVFGEDTDREIARAFGADVDEQDEPDEVAPIECLRCGESTPQEKPFCIHCFQALDSEAAQLVDDITSGFESIAVKSDDPQERAEAIGASRTIREEAGRMSREDLHSLASELS